MHSSNNKNEEGFMPPNQLIRSNSFISNHRAYTLEKGSMDFSAQANETTAQLPLQQNHSFGMQNAQVSADALAAGKSNSTFFLSKPSSIFPQMTPINSQPFVSHATNFSQQSPSMQKGTPLSNNGPFRPSAQSQSFAQPAFFGSQPVRSPFQNMPQNAYSMKHANMNQPAFMPNNMFGANTPIPMASQQVPSNSPKDFTSGSATSGTQLPAGLREYRLSALLSQWQEKPVSVVNSNLLQLIPMIAGQIINGSIQNNPNFVNSVVKVLAIYGISLKKLPEIRGSSIDLFTFYSAVTSIGGYRKVTAERKWAIVASALGYSFATSGMSITEYENFLLILRCLYSKILYFYEQIFFGRISPVNTTESVVPPGITGPMHPAQEPACNAPSAEPSPVSSAAQNLLAKASIPVVPTVSTEQFVPYVKKDPATSEAELQRMREASDQKSKPPAFPAEPLAFMPNTQPPQAAAVKSVNKVPVAPQNTQNISMFLRNEFEFIRREFLTIQIVNSSMPYRHQPVSDYGKINSKKLKLSFSSGITCEVSYAINALNSLALNGASSGLSFRSLPWLIDIFNVVLSADLSEIDDAFCAGNKQPVKCVWIKSIFNQDHGGLSIFCSFAKNLKFSVLIALRNILFYSANLVAEIESLNSSSALLIALLKICSFSQDTCSPDYVLFLNAMEILSLISRYLDLSDLLAKNNELSLNLEAFANALVKIFEEHRLPFFTNSAIDASEWKQPRYDWLKSVVLRDFRILVSSVSYNYPVLNPFKIGLNFLCFLERKCQLAILNSMLHNLFFPIFSGPLATFLASLVSFVKFFFNPTVGHPLKKEDMALAGTFWLENILFSRYLSLYDFGMIENILEAAILYIETHFKNVTDAKQYLNDPLQIDFESLCKIFLSIFQLLPFYSEKIQKPSVAASTLTDRQKAAQPAAGFQLTCVPEIAAHVKVAAWTAHSSLLLVALQAGRLLVLASAKHIPSCISNVVRVQKLLFECLIFVKPSQCYPPQDPNYCIVEDMISLASELLAVEENVALPEESR